MSIYAVTGATVLQGAVGEGRVGDWVDRAHGPKEGG